MHHSAPFRTPRSAFCRAVRCPAPEVLEEQSLSASMLYVDFGFNFPAGGLVVSIEGGAGNDTFLATLMASNGTQIGFHSEAGNDRLVTTPGRSTLIQVFGGPGRDLLQLRRGAASFTGIVLSERDRNGRFNFLGRLPIHLLRHRSVHGNPYSIFA